MKKFFLTFFLTSSLVFSQNIPPVAISEVGKAFSEVTTNITLNAVDQDGDNLTYTLISSPTNGSATITDGVLTYTSSSGFTGSDTITYKVNDGFSDSNEATFQINVIDKALNLNWANYTTGNLNASTQDNSGNIFTSGNFTFSNFKDDTALDAVNSAGLGDGYVAKYNTNGDLQWVNTFGGQYSDDGGEISVGSDGNIIMVGTIRGLATFNDGSTLDTGLLASGETDFKTIVIKLDSSDGSIIWKRLIDVSRLSGFNLALTSNDDIIISSSYFNPASYNNGDNYLFKVSYVDGSIIVDNKILKSVSPNSSSVGPLTELIIDNNDNIIITGGYRGDLDIDLSSGVTSLLGDETSSTYVIKYNSNFELVWSMGFVSSEATAGNSLAYDSINDLIYFSGAAYDVDMNPLGDPVNLDYNDNLGWFVASYNSDGIYQDAHLFAADSNSGAADTKLRVQDDKLIVFGKYKETPDLDITSETFFPTVAGNSYRSRYVSIYDLSEGATLTGQYFLGQNNEGRVPKEVFLNGNNLIVSTWRDREVQLYDYNYNPLVTLSNITYENNSSIYGSNGLVSFKIGDVTIPVITLAGDATVDIEVGSTYTDAGATASDNYDGDITSSIVTVNPVDTDVVGQYTVTYNVSDANSNAAVEVTRTVNVVDTTVPVITLAGNATVDIEVGSTYTDAGATASDNYDGDITSSIVTVNPVDTDVVGQYTVTYNVSDTNSNAAVEVTRTVNVVVSLSIVDNDEIKLSIFPNPTSTSWHIKTKTIINSILLYDILGRKVYFDTPNNKDVQINAKFLPNGFYLLVINKTESFKLIKK